MPLKDLETARAETEGVLLEFATFLEHPQVCLRPSVYEKGMLKCLIHSGA